MDDVDRKLLALIQHNCRLSYAQLGKAVGLSVSAVNERLKKLCAQGVVKRSVAILNPQALGLDMLAFIQTAIDRPENEGVFYESVLGIPEVLECHHITGEFSYLLKIRARNTSHLESLLMNRIRTIKGVKQTHTFIVLSTLKETTMLGLDGVTADRIAAR